MLNYSEISHGRIYLQIVRRLHCTILKIAKSENHPLVGWFRKSLEVGRDSKEIRSHGGRARDKLAKLNCLEYT